MYIEISPSVKQKSQYVLNGPYYFVNGVVDKTDLFQNHQLVLVKKSCLTHETGSTCDIKIDVT